MSNAETIAAGLSTKAALEMRGHWPRNSWRLHSAHIRHFNRHRLIEQHNATDYRLTPLGLEVCAILEKRNG